MQRRPYVVRWEYRTEILLSRSGKEQRRVLRETCRKSIQYSASLTGMLWRELVQTLVSGQQQEWWLPDQSRVVSLDDGMAAGDTVTLSSIPAWAVVGAQIVLRDFDRLESLEIESIAGTSVTFVDATLKDWPAGSLMYPALFGALSVSLPTRTLLGEFIDANISFEVNPTTETVEPPLEADDTFNGRDVWLLEPYRLAPVEISHNQIRDVVDYGQGKVERFHPVPFSTRLWRGTYPSVDGDRPDQIRSLFDRMLGQCGEFYMPTFEYDLIPLESTIASTNTLLIEGTTFQTIYSGSTTYRAVAVYYDDGTVFFNLVSSIEQSLGNSLIRFTDYWPQDISTTTKISWMPVWRFATDILELPWMFDLSKPPKLWSSAQLTLQMLEDL